MHHKNKRIIFVQVNRFYIKMTLTSLLLYVTLKNEVMFAAFFDKTRQLYKIFYSFIHSTKNTVFVVNYSNIYSTGFMFALLRVVFRFNIVVKIFKK